MYFVRYAEVRRMDAMRAVFLCVAGALVCALLRQQKPEMRTAAAIAVGLAALFLSLDGLGAGVEMLRLLCGEAGMAEENSLLLIRATGIALLAEFGAQLCRDAEESALAGRVELAGRVALMGMSAPLLTGLFQRIEGILM